MRDKIRKIRCKRKMPIKQQDLTFETTFPRPYSSRRNRVITLQHLQPRNTKVAELETPVGMESFYARGMPWG